jgi:hypothetical protein
MMTASIVVHEVLGHGLAYVLSGSEGIRFAINPGFSGWASGIGSGYSSGAWIVRFGGILANAGTGLCALALLRFRRPTLRPSELVIFWLIATELGHALGYALQGLLFRQGDAGVLPSQLGPIGTVVAVGVLILVFLGLARWALGAMTGFVLDHYEPATVGAFRRAFLSSFTLPMTVIIVVAPGLPHRAAWTIIAFDAGITLVLVLGSLWITRGLPPAVEPKGSPLSWRHFLSWALGALALLAITALWLSKGVTLSL